MVPKPPPTLVRYLRERRCVLFCGSGLSAWARLPTWTKLLGNIVKELEQELQDDPNIDELNRMLSAGKLLEVADHCKQALGQRYNDILSEQLRGDGGEIPDPHKAIVQMPFSAVVTTNYDKLLERSYASVGSLPKTPTHRDVDALGPLLFDGSFFILKAHGDIDRPDGMVLTTRDYQEIIHANPAFNTVFSAILLTKAIFFVGYSLNDPDFRLLLDRQLTIFSGNVPARFALMSGVGKVERDVLLRSAGIRVLTYEEGKHEQVLEFLHALLDQTRVAPVAAPLVSRSAAKDLSDDVVAPPQPAAIATAVPVPVARTILSIRLAGRNLEASFSSNGHVVQGLGDTPNWRLLSKLMPAALKRQSGATVLGKSLATCLPAAVVSALESLPAADVITLKLGTQVELLPWEMAVVGKEFLCLRNPVVRAPVDVSDTARGHPMMRDPARILLIGDPNRGDAVLQLQGSFDEINDIVTVYQGAKNVMCTLLIGPDASFDKVATELSSGDYDVVHFAGHAWFAEDLEPFLMLSGEVKLRSGELRSLISASPPAVLVLNSHFTAFTPPGLSAPAVKKGEDDAEKLAPSGQRGFIEAATTAGVGVLVGSFTGGLDDRIAQVVGVNLHKELLKGQPIARALHHSVLLNRVADPDANPTHLTYAVSGYGDIVLRR